MPRLACGNAANAACDLSMAPDMVWCQWRAICESNLDRLWFVCAAQAVRLRGGIGAVRDARCGAGGPDREKKRPCARDRVTESEFVYVQACPSHMSRLSACRPSKCIL